MLCKPSELVVLVKTEVSARDAEVFPLPDLIGGIRSCYMLLLYSALFWRVSLGSCFFPERFPGFSGIKNSWRDCFAAAGDVLGSLLFVFFSCRSFTKNFYSYLLPAL